MQTYFQLMRFEEDIPGVECNRPENAKRRLLKEAGGSEGVMLEENVNKELEAKSAAKNEVAEEANPEGEDNSKPKKRERKKKHEEDEKCEETKISLKEEEVKNVKSVPKSNIIEQAVKRSSLLYL